MISIRCDRGPAVVLSELEGDITLGPTKKQEGVKKLLQIERVGKDIEKILQRYLIIALTTHNDKL
jgi:hypothetical protein